MSEENKVEKAVDLSLLVVETLAEAAEDYTVTFNALSMAAVSLLIPYMQDTGIPLTTENLNAQFEKFSMNLGRAKDFIVTHSNLLKEQPIDQEPIV